MIQYEIKDTLEVGNIVAITIHRPFVHTAYFKAKKLTNKRPCSLQCDLHTWLRCNGYCYRWDNYKDIVFVYADEPQGDYEVVETPFAANVRKITEQLMEQQKEEMPITSNEPQD